MDKLKTYISMLVEIKNAKKTNNRNYWELHDKAADFYNKNFKRGTKECSVAALTRIGYV